MAINLTPVNMRNSQKLKDLYIFMFQAITLKQLSSLTSTDTFSWLGGLKVTY